MTRSDQSAGVREPPDGILRSLRYLGPGFILSAAIVGSGELIATTALGARTGFVLMWAIIISCLVKVAIQVEYGRHSITHGRSSLEAWNSGSGPRLWRAHWTVYAALLFMLSSWVGMAGVMGGAAQILVYRFPQTSVEAWVALLALLLALMVFRGKYESVERISAFFNFAFVSTVLYCNFAAQRTEYAFTIGDLAGGFTFHLPPEGIALVVAVFGITGVGSGEVVMYPYWCLEKGYASWTGPRDHTPEWGKRARGWIRVMQLDAVLSMAVYTVATCAFYLLGASVLRPQGRVADGNELVLQLSRLFTMVLGEGSMLIFMVCAFTVLFSTLFSNVAGFSRLWADVFRVFRIIEPADERQRLRVVAAASFALPAIWGLAYAAFQKPLGLVVVMGISNALFLLVVAYQAVVFRYRSTDRRLVPSRAYDAALWLSIFSIAFMAWKVIESLAP